MPLIIRRPHLNPSQQAHRQKQDAELRRYSLVGDGGWLTWLKIAVAILLGGWNIHFFLSLVGGIMGYLTAAVAAHIEITAVYCFHNHPRSIGRHKKALLVLSIVLMTFSTIHAVFAMITYTGYANGNKFVDFYSNVMALPIIVVLLTVTTMTLTMTHPKAKIIAALAAGKLQSMMNRSETLIEENRVIDANELMELKAHLFEIESAAKKALIPIIKDRIRTEQELLDEVDSISNPEVRYQIRNALDAISKKQLPPANP